MNIRLTIPVLIWWLWIMTMVMEYFFLPAMHRIAKKLKLSDDIAWATLMSIATSAPEISTALIALFFSSTAAANPALWLWTIVWSALFQILVVLWFVGIVRKSQLKWRPIVRDMVVYLIAVSLLFFLVSDDLLTIWDWLILLATYGLYIVFLLRWNKKYPSVEHTDAFDEVEKEAEGVLTKTFAQKNIWGIFVASIAAIWLISYYLVLAAESVAGWIGIPSVIIALTVLAGGSSIPELIWSAQVSKEWKGDMAVANAVWSNVFDILVSFGLPLTLYVLITWENISGFAGSQLTWSFYLLLASVAVVLWLFALRKFLFDKYLWRGLVIAYVVYVLWIALV